MSPQFNSAPRQNFTTVLNDKTEKIEWLVVFVLWIVPSFAMFVHSSFSVCKYVIKNQTGLNSILKHRLLYWTSFYWHTSGLNFRTVTFQSLFIPAWPFSAWPVGCPSSTVIFHGWQSLFYSCSQVVEPTYCWNSGNTVSCNNLYFIFLLAYC